MNWADYAILAILGVSALIGIWRGFVKEALSLTAWILAIWVAYTFSERLGVFFEPHIATPSVRLGVAFAALFVATLLITAVVNFLINKLVASTGLTGTDRMLGIVFGIVRGAAIVTIIVMLAGLTPIPQDPWWSESLFMDHFQNAAVWVKGFLPEGFAKHIKFAVVNAATDL